MSPAEDGSGDGSRADAAPDNPADARPSEVDAAGEHIKTEMTLSQTNSVSITSGVGCRIGPDELILENSYYRAFELADHGAIDGFIVKKVTFGLLKAVSNQPERSQPAELSIYAYGGPVGGDALDLSKLERRAHVGLMVADTLDPVIIDIPLPTELSREDSTLVVELHVPEGEQQMHEFWVGANQAGERAPAYQFAPRCGQNVPVSFPAAGLQQFALVLSVTGDG